MPKKMHGGRDKKQIPGRKISHVVLGSRFSLERWLLNTQKADVFGYAAEKLLESDMVPSEAEGSGGHLTRRLAPDNILP